MSKEGAETQDANFTQVRMHPCAKLAQENCLLSTSYQVFFFLKGQLERKSGDLAIYTRVILSGQTVQ